jgi:predicted permease
MRLLVSEADRRTIEGDLAELYELRRRQRGEAAARRWLRRQRVLYPLHLSLDGLRAAIHERTATMLHLWRDIRYSLRSLARTPATALTIVLTVGIALGATAAMIGIVRAVLLNPLPYADPGSLVWIYTDSPPFKWRFSVVDYRALEADHPAFGIVAAYQTSRVTISENGAAERATVKSVTGSYFPLFGLRAEAGRLFDPTDDRHNESIAVLTHAYWTRRFGADPSVVGRRITIDGASYAIVGVLQRSSGPFEHDIAAFTAAHWPPPTRKGPFFTTALGRLRPGVSYAVARDALRATNARLFPIWRSSYQDEKATWGVMDLSSRVVGKDIGSTLMFILAAVACLLLIACANAVNLLVGRALGRSRELAIRGALGASRGRLLQHLFAETAVLTIGAALIAFAVTATVIKLVGLYGADYLPRIDEIRLTAPVIGWLALLAAASGALIGLIPALHSSRQRMDRTLASGGRSSSDAPAARRLRRALVAAEFALATPLLVAGALVFQSLDRLSHVDVGIDTARILTADVSLSGPRYADESDRRTFWTRTVERLSALPGVEGAAIVDSRPPNDAGNLNNFDLEDHPATQGQNQPVCPWISASPGFFKTVGLRLERGRIYDERDFRADAPPVIVVDRAWANRFFPDQEVLGRRLHEGGCTNCPWTTVIGVVSTVKFTGLDAPDEGTVYSPFVDWPTGYVVLRTPGDPAHLTPMLRQAMTELDPALPVSEVATGDDLVAGALATPRYLTVLIGVFGLTALVLSVVGIYGVMAYFVQQHTRDIGIRLALGGEPSAMRRMVVVQGLQLVAGGVVLGAIAALLTGRLMTTVLYGVTPTDARTMVSVPAALVVVAIIACLIPARRAARLDPAEILRES